MHKTKTEWADYAWNPITGCRNQQRCRLCYIDTGAKRFSGDVLMNKAATGKYEKRGDLYILDEKFGTESGGVLTMPFRSEPTYYRYRLKSLDQLKGGQNVLVSYEGEMFGPWVPDDIIQEIFNACMDHPKNHYLFVTSFPERYEDLRKKHMLPEGDQYWYGSSIGFGTQEVFQNDAYHCFEVVSPVPKNSTIDPKMEWCIVGGWSQQTPMKYREPIDKSRTDSFIQTCNDWNIPVFVERTLNPDETDYTTLHQIPEILVKKQLSRKKAEKLETECFFCGRKDRKKNMIAILARPKRSVTAPCLGYIHPDELKEFCERNHMDAEGYRKTTEAFGGEHEQRGVQGSNCGESRGKSVKGRKEEGVQEVEPGRENDAQTGTGNPENV